MCGAAPIMRSMFMLLERAAVTDSTVLLEGESGTGKEIIAESLHAASQRAERPFIVVDCAAIPPNLIESELFGHEKGAFTGAQSARAGAVEEASGGTLFLDEIGELPLDLQPKFLRALERRQVKRIGSATLSRRRRARRGGDQPRSRAPGRGGALPRRSLLSPRRRQGVRAAAARASAGRADAGAPLRARAAPVERSARAA